jgi:hypothetical protein
MFHFAFCHRCVETGMLPISLAERIPRVCDPRNSGNDFLERAANFSEMRHTNFDHSGEIGRQSGQRESNPHGQLGRLELYH